MNREDIDKIGFLMKMDKQFYSFSPFFLNFQIKFHFSAIYE